MPCKVDLGLGHPNVKAKDRPLLKTSEALKWNPVYRPLVLMLPAVARRQRASQVLAGGDPQSSVQCPAPGSCLGAAHSLGARGRSQKPVALLRNHLLEVCRLCLANLGEETRVAGRTSDLDTKLWDLDASRPGKSYNLFELEFSSQFNEEN